MKKITYYLGAFLLFFLSVARAESVLQSYEEIDAATQSDSLPKAELIEFFWYECPHCYRMESLLSEAGLNDRVVKIPAVLRGSWMFTARVFYAMQAMGIEKQMHQKVFDDIHQNKLPLKNEEHLNAFLKRHGFDQKEFMTHFNSDMTNQKAHEAAVFTRQFAENGVPAFVVKNRFVTYPGIAGSLEETLETVESLLK